MLSRMAPGFERLKAHEIDPMALFRVTAGGDGGLAGPGLTATSLTSLTSLQQEGAHLQEMQGLQDMQPRMGSWPPGAKDSTSQHSCFRTRYLAMGSADRDWTAEPFRYSYTMRFGAYADNSGANVLRDVRELMITRVILPLEINERPSLAVITARTVAPNYINDYNFKYPYLTVRLEGFENDMYDGSNDAIRRAFCAVVFDRAFRAPNGRGYVILRPMQDEKKLFAPAPLASLRSFRIELLRPNGALLNNGTDEHRIRNFDYEDSNPAHVVVVLDRFFDKNEFFVGDSVRFSGYAASPPEGAVSDGSFEAFATFVNRPEGHEIVEIGQSNESGFYNSFYVPGPGYLDKAAGRLVMEQTYIDALRVFNNQAGGRAPQGGSNGAVCNTSLQNVIAMTAVQQLPDARTF